MERLKCLFIAMILVQSFNSNGQKIELNGDLSFLKEVKSVQLVFDYSGMSVGKFENGEEYVALKKKEYNEKEPGKGDKWENEWLSDRTTRFQVNFQKALSLKYTAIDFNENNKSEFKLIVRTVSTEPGFNAYIERKPAMVDLEMKFISDSGEEMAVLKMEKVPGRDVKSYAPGPRIEGAYSRAGATLGKFLIKNVN